MQGIIHNICTSMRLGTSCSRSISHLGIGVSWKVGDLSSRHVYKARDTSHRGTGERWLEYIAIYSRVMNSW